MALRFGKMVGKRRTKRKEVRNLLGTIGLLHNHWFLIEEGGLEWDRMAVTLFSQCDRKLLNC